MEVIHDKEDVILGHILNDKNLCGKVISYLEPIYFNDKKNSYIFKILRSYYSNHDDIPNNSILVLESSKIKNISVEEKNNIVNHYDNIKKSTLDIKINEEWFKKEVETFCKTKATVLSVEKSIDIIEKGQNIDELPAIFEKAVSIKIDDNNGLDYFNLEDINKRYDYYENNVIKIPTGISELDRATDGGFEYKTINVILGGTGTGKTLSMIAMASNMVRRGYNVLYYTLEMSELKISQRFDANMLNIDIDKLKNLKREEYITNINNIKDKIKGRLKIKEYPTNGANVNHIKAHLKDLKARENFIPDVIVVDYINILGGIHTNVSMGSYTHIKQITEDLRGLASLENVCIITATQTTRTGYDSSDVMLSDVSESFGIAHTADFFVGIIQNEDMKEQGKMMMKQLKSRYGDMSKIPFWFVGVDKAKMKYYDLDVDVNTQIVKQAMVNNSNNERLKSLDVKIKR